MRAVAPQRRQEFCALRIQQVILSNLEAANYSQTDLKKEN
jgi:hypothetical protein